MDLAAAAGARATRMSLLWAGREQLVGRSDTVLRDLGLRDRRERADASMRSTVLGECSKSVDAACAWVFIILTSRSFFLRRVQSLRLGDKRNSNEVGY